MKGLFVILIIISSQAIIVACDTTTHNDCDEYSGCAEYLDMSKKELLNAYCNTEAEYNYRKEKEKYYKDSVDKLTAAGKTDSIIWDIKGELFLKHNKKLQEVLIIRRDMYFALRENYGMSDYDVYDVYDECGWDTKRLDEHHSKYGR